MRVLEQNAIDRFGGIGKVRNKRNEIAQTKRQNFEHNIYYDKDAWGVIKKRKKEIKKLPYNYKTTPFTTQYYL